MNRYEIRQEENEMEVILVSRVSPVVPVLLGGISALCLLAPFVLFLLFAETPVEERGAGPIFGIFVALGVGLWFGRMFLWNTFGREILAFSPGKVKIEYDFKLFRTVHQTFNFEWLECTIGTPGGVTTDRDYAEFVVLLKTESEFYQSLLKLRESDAGEICRVIRERFGSQDPDA